MLSFLRARVSTPTPANTDLPLILPNFAEFIRNLPKLERESIHLQLEKSQEDGYGGKIGRALDKVKTPYPDAKHTFYKELSVVIQTAKSIDELELDEKTTANAKAFGQKILAAVKGALLDRNGHLKTEIYDELRLPALLRANPKFQRDSRSMIDGLIASCCNVLTQNWASSFNNPALFQSHPRYLKTLGLIGASTIEQRISEPSTDKLKNLTAALMDSGSAQVLAQTGVVHSDPESKLLTSQARASVNELIQQLSNSIAEEAKATKLEKLMECIMEARNIKTTSQSQYSFSGVLFAILENNHFITRAILSDTVIFTMQLGSLLVGDQNPASAEVWKKLDVYGDGAVSKRLEYGKLVEEILQEKFPGIFNVGQPESTATSARI